jgi:hypothetical protein
MTNPITGLTANIEPTIDENGVTLSWTLTAELDSQSVYYTTHHIHSTDSTGQNQDVKEESENKMLDIDRSAENITLFDLVQSRTYTFTVIGVASSDGQTYSQQVDIYIDPSKVPNIETDIALSLQGTNKSLTVSIEYIGTTFTYTETKMQEYQLMIHGKFEGDATKNTRILTVQAANTELTTVDLKTALGVNLINNTEYYEVSIRASNDVGWTEMSSTKVETPATTPNHVVNLALLGGEAMNGSTRSNVSVSPTDETLLVVWTQAAQIQNDPDTHYSLTIKDQASTVLYTVELSNNTVDLIEVTNGNGTHMSKLLTSSELALVDGTEYTVEVVSYNSTGNSATATANGIPSGQVSAITDLVTRTGKDIVTAGHDGYNSSNKIELSFTVPDTNGTHITSYDFNFNGTVVNKTSTDLSVTPGTLVTHVFGASEVALTNGTEQTITVTKNTANGPVISSSVTATPSTLPAQVQGVVVIPAPDAESTLGSGNIQVDWTLLADLASEKGGSEVTQYDISGAIQMYTVNGNATSTQAISGLVDGTQYSMKVRAVNANGEGDWSSVKLAKPSVPPRVEGGISTTSVFNEIKLDLQNIVISSGGYDTSSVEVSVKDVNNTLVGAPQNIQFPVSSEVTFNLSSFNTGNPNFTVEVRPYNNVYESEDVTNVYTMPLLTKDTEATIENLSNNAVFRDMDNKLEFNWDTIVDTSTGGLFTNVTDPSYIEVWVASSAPTSTTTNTNFAADPIASDYKYIETISKDDVQYILTGNVAEGNPLTVYDDKQESNPQNITVTNGTKWFLKLKLVSISNIEGFADEAVLHVTESIASGIPVGAPVVNNISFNYGTNTLSFTVNPEGAILTELISFHEMGRGDAIDLLTEVSNSGALQSQYTGDITVTHTDSLMISGGNTSKKVTIIANHGHGMTYAVSP